MPQLLFGYLPLNAASIMPMQLGHMQSGFCKVWSKLRRAVCLLPVECGNRRLAEGFASITCQLAVTLCSVHAYATTATALSKFIAVTNQRLVAPYMMGDDSESSTQEGWVTATGAGTTCTLHCVHCMEPGYCSIKHLPGRSLMELQYMAIFLGPQTHTKHHIQQLHATVKLA